GKRDYSEYGLIGSAPRSSIRALARRRLAFADGVLLAQLGPATDLARLFVMIVFAQFLGDSAAFEQLFEAAQGGADWFAVVDSHLQRLMSPVGLGSREGGGGLNVPPAK